MGWWMRHWNSTGEAHPISMYGETSVNNLAYSVYGGSEDTNGKNIPHRGNPGCIRERVLTAIFSRMYGMSVAKNSMFVSPSLHEAKYQRFSLGRDVSWQAFQTILVRVRSLPRPEGCFLCHSKQICTRQYYLHVFDGLEAVLEDVLLAVQERKALGALLHLHLRALFVLVHDESVLMMP